MLAVTEPTDAELVARARRGDRDAYGCLVTRHQAVAASLAYSVCGDVAHSQDLAQEAFVTGWQRLGTLDDPAKFKPWLGGIVRHLALDAVRKRTRRGDRPPAHELAAHPIDPAPGPHESAAARDEAALVWQALEKLPAAYREPLVLFYREEQSIARVAVALDLTEDAVKQRLARGRALLREEIEQAIARSLAASRARENLAGSVLAALPGPLPPGANLFQSFFVHLTVAWMGARWQRERKTPPRFGFGTALIIWGAIAMTCLILWLLT